jgi:hypothetical protein
MQYTLTVPETLHALCFTAEKKVIQISELTSHFKLYLLKQLTQPYSYDAATTALLEVSTFHRATLFSEIKHFKLSYV